jgi:HEAT repeat protein
MGDLERTEAREPMERMLREKRLADDWHRILDALGKLGDPAAAPAVRRFLEDDVERRRIYAAAALAELKDAASAGALTERLSDPALTVRAAASRALRRLGPVSVEPICRSLEEGAERRAIRLRTLGGIAAALADSTGEESLHARARARRCLMDELDRPPGTSPPAARAAAVESLWGLGDDETRAFVRLRMLDEPDPLVRRTYEASREGE